MTELATVRTYWETAIRMKESHMPEGTAARLVVRWRLWRVKSHVVQSDFPVSKS